MSTTETPTAKELNRKVELYGLLFKPTLNKVVIEMDMIQRGGRWKKKDGTFAGNGLFFHYKRFQELVWPEDSHHRWSDLMLEEILNNTITAILGPKDSGKTHCALSKFGLTDYFCFPQKTLILISSTDVRGLELRVWGDLKSLFQRAKNRFPWLPGQMIDSKHAISTDSLQEDETRDMRKGIVCIPCMSSGGGWVGLGKYIGIKQERRRLLADETQVMRPAFLDAVANLNSGDFKGVFVGNPLGEGDPLDKVSEPKGGWGTEGEVLKTATWDNKFLNGRTINLVGTDSPNFDQSQEPEPKYPWMINQKSIDAVSAFYGKDSLQYCSQCLGIRRTGINARRVITRKMCVQFGAFEPVIWKDGKQTKIAGLDAAWGNIGGDRCVGGHIEFGIDVNGTNVINIIPPHVVPVSVRDADMALPEDQIALHMRQYCEENDIPSNNAFYDSTGRGSLGNAFARNWSPNTNAVEFGGNPTERPVSLSLYTYDEEARQRRLKRCDEHYSKFVTELWFTVRYIIEGKQMRGLTEELMEEGTLREWKLVRGDKTEIESKADTKERMGRSPDLFDWLAICCEGARRRGFNIEKMVSEQKEEDDSWKLRLRKRSENLRSAWSLENV